MNRYSIIRNIDTVVTALRKAKRAGLGGVVDCEYATMRSDPSGATKVFLQSCLEYATANVPYYRGRSAMLSDFPRLRKDEIRTYFEQLQATDRSMRQGVVENTSGGSTGVPVKLLQDAPYQRNVGRALRYFYEEMIGCEIASVRKLMIWGSERDILNWSGDWSKEELKGLKSRTVYRERILTDAIRARANCECPLALPSGTGAWLRELPARRRGAPPCEADKISPPAIPSSAARSA